MAVGDGFSAVAAHAAAAGAGSPAVTVQKGPTQTATNGATGDPNTIAGQALLAKLALISDPTALFNRANSLASQYYGANSSAISPILQAGAAGANNISQFN